LDHDEHTTLSQDVICAQALKALAALQEIDSFGLNSEDAKAYECARDALIEIQRWI
jgi:hypothetical protein